jgi:hypothetical protein
MIARCSWSVAVKSGIDSALQARLLLRQFARMNLLGGRGKLGASIVSMILTLNDPGAAVADLYWQDVLHQLNSALQLHGVSTSLVCRKLPVRSDSKSGATEIIEAIQIGLTVALVPVLISVIREFAAVRKTKSFTIRTDKGELSFNAMNPSEIDAILSNPLLKHALRHGTADKKVR